MAYSESLAGVRQAFAGNRAITEKEMEQSFKEQKRPSPQREGEGRIARLEIRIASARKSPPAHSSNAHFGRISHHSRYVQRNRMQSYRSRRMIPESKCSGRTTHIQAGREPPVQNTHSRRDRRSLPHLKD